jgi:hypothetical protein
MIIKGIKSIKSDRPPWINRLQYEFVKDLKHDRDPTIQLRRAYLEMEKCSRRVKAEYKLYLLSLVYFYSGSLGIYKRKNTR